MSSPERGAVRDADAEALHRACAVIGAAETPDVLDDAEIQALLGAAVRLYAQRAAMRDEPLPALPAAR